MQTNNSKATIFFFNKKKRKKMKDNICSGVNHATVTVSLSSCKDYLPYLIIKSFYVQRV